MDLATLIVIFLLVAYSSYVTKVNLSLEKRVDKDGDLTCVEFHVLPKRYYPVYKNKYMRRDYGTRLLLPIGRHLFNYAHYCSTEEEAKAMIEDFKEQEKNDNVIIIKE